MENLLLLFDQPDHLILQQVGWTRLVKEISKHAYFECNQKKLKRSPNFKSKKELKLEYDRLNMFMSYILSEKWKNYYKCQARLGPTVDAEKMLVIIEKQVLFSLYEINDFILFWELSESIPKELDNSFQLPSFETNRVLNFKKKLSKEFRTFVDYTGHADFTLHPVIGALMKKLVDFERKTSDMLISMVKKYGEYGLLQYNNFDIINGRYVLPIRTDRFSNGMGKIIHRSDSGATLHVELNQIFEFSNTRNKIQDEIEHEIFVLEKKYSEVLVEYASELKQIILSNLAIDYYGAKAKWSYELQGCIPNLTDEFNFNLEEFYHPLIANSVKNNFNLSNRKKVMLISGPNTGGKSIILKALAINYLLLQNGLPLAAKSASFSSFNSIFYLASDGQDLEKGLSSFAAESEKLVTLMNEAQKESILLVDEIFNSTSSEEASSIAYSVMNYWQHQNLGPAIYTSHHQSLKTWVHENELMESAHVGFDLLKEHPTYVLHIGVPGSSYATKIFEKYLRRSPKLLTLMDLIEAKQAKGFNYENILKKVQDRENEYLELTQIEKNQVAKLKAELNAQKIDLERKKAEELEKLRLEIDKIKRKGLNIISSLGNRSQAVAKVFENEFWSINKEVEKLDSIEEKEVEVDNSKFRNKPEKIIEGCKYFSTQWNRVVEVLKVHENTSWVEVLMGKIKTRVKQDALFETEIKKKVNFTTNIDRTNSTSIILDARGMRLDVFQKEIDIGLSFVITGDLPYFEVIHGHGDGVLKTWLRQYLKENDEMFYFEIPDSSADGVTKVFLR